VSLRVGLRLTQLGDARVVVITGDTRQAFTNQHFVHEPAVLRPDVDRPARRCCVRRPALVLQPHPPVQHEVRQATLRWRAAWYRLDAAQSDASSGLHLKRAAVDHGCDEQRLRALERYMKLRNRHDRNNASTHNLHWHRSFPELTSA
jgi:hypothetical protein